MLVLIVFPLDNNCIINTEVIIDKNIGIIDENIDRKYGRKYCFPYFCIYISPLGWNYLICAHKKSMCGKKGLLQV